MVNAKNRVIMKKNYLFLLLGALIIAAKIHTSDEVSKHIIRYFKDNLNINKKLFMQLVRQVITA